MRQLRLMDIKMTVGQKFITLYFALVYLLPMVARMCLGDNIVSSYHIYPLSFFAVSVLIITYLSFLLMTAIPSHPLMRFSLFKNRVDKIGQLYLKYRSIIVILTLFIAIANYRGDWGLNTYRYSAQTISEKNSMFLLFVIVINTIISVDLFYCMFVKSYEQIVNQSLKSYVENVLLSLVLVMLANGTASAFLAFCALFFSVFPRLFRWSFFNKQVDSNKLKNTKLFFASSIIVMAFVPSWFYGELIKSKTSMMDASYFGHVENNATSVQQSSVTGTDDASLYNKLSGITDNVAGLENQFALNYFYYFVESLSVYYYSYLFTIDATPEILNHGVISPLVFPLHSLLFRADYVLGKNLAITRPAITSISQLNYQLLTKEEINVRTGSSPGLLGSFNYLFRFPFNILLCIAYLLFVSNLINVLFSRHSGYGTLSLAGLVLLFPYLQVFFQSPFDLVMVFDNCAIYASLIVGIYICLRGNNYIKDER